MNRRRVISFVIVLAAAAGALCCADIVRAQMPRLSGGKDFKLPLYYPASNGVRAIKTIVTGTEWHFVTNGIVALTQPRITNYHANGAIEWIVTSPECTVDVNSREARGRTNIFFKTADEQVYQTGVGFLWQHSTGLIILSNRVHTWIDKQALTKKAPGMR